jgi:hypothetical protein
MNLLPNDFKWLNMCCSKWNNNFILETFFLKNLNQILIMEFWRVEIEPYFHKSFSKWIFLNLEIFLDFMDYFLRPFFQITSTIEDDINVLGFDLSLGRFVGGWTCNSERLKQLHFTK